jgi:hypothetical protein
MTSIQNARGANTPRAGVARRSISGESNVGTAAPAVSIEPLPDAPHMAPYNSDHTHLQEYLADARGKGPKYAQEAGIHWTVNKKRDPLEPGCRLSRKLEWLKTAPDYEHYGCYLIIRKTLRSLPASDRPGAY